MNFFDKIDINNLHHAYCIESNKNLISSDLYSFLEKRLLFNPKGNPDFSLEEFDVLKIDDARKIVEWSYGKSLSSGGRKIFVIFLNFMTREAQNSLLKIFEDPPSKTHFFILTPFLNHILPTLQSRFLILKKEDRLNSIYIVEDFLMSNYVDRLKIVKKIIEDKNKSEAIIFLNECEIFLRNKVDLKNITEEEVLIFCQIRSCRDYLHNSSPSVKNIIEYMSLILPRILK